ncbi:tail fiber domain-containing protein [Proteus terrae]|uniref:tail fiber/spike domain-containing protein n=1 Tax=Proteus terrae TaxID=1574161 RepID=UPI0013309F1B|nr:tail fiber domain-containing protein [Proteus terrae]
MSTIPTQNPVPSEAASDLKYNSGKIDEFVTSMKNKYIDRFGQEHFTIEGLRWVAQQAISQFGYITLDSFQKGVEITLPNQVLRDEITGEYYRWDGVLPKSVPVDSTPENSGGVGLGKWVSVGDASLRRELSENSGSSLIGTKTGDTVEERFSSIEQDVKESAGKSLSNIKIFAELPLRPAGYGDILEKYNYKYIYPQGMCFFDDDNEIYITCSGVGGDNNWAWIYVYDRDSLSLKSIFSAGDTNSEGLYVTKIDGDKYLFILDYYSGSGNGKTGVYKLPNDVSSVNMTRLTAYNVCNTRQYFQIAGYNNQIIIEVNNGSDAPQFLQRRTKFNYYDARDLLENIEPTPIGAISVDKNIEKIGKRQGIAITPNGLITSGGAYTPYGGDVNDENIFSFRTLTFSGNETGSLLCDPNKLCDQINPYLKQKATRMENEGCAYTEKNGDGIILSLNVLNTDNDVGGIFLFEHFISSADKNIIDASPAILLDCLDNNNDTNIDIAIIPYDKLQNKRLTTLKQILDRMNRDGVQVYQFYNGYTPYVTDINGMEITPSCSVTIKNFNSYSYLVTVSGNRTNYQMFITGDIGGPYTQHMDSIATSPFNQIRPEFLSRGVKIQGVNGLPCDNYYTNNPGKIAIARYYSGDNSSPMLTGSIIVDGSSGRTSFNTTSDERLKVDKGEYTNGLDKILKLISNNALRNFEWKHNGHKQYGLMAQRVSGVIPDAVSYDKDTDTYMVNYSAIIPDIISAIAELSKRK